MKNIFLIATLLVSLLLGGHQSAEAYTWVNKSTEIQAGNQASAQLYSSSYDDPRIRRIGEYLVSKLPNMGSQIKYKYSFRTIKSEWLNALCYPNGNIYLYSSLLNYSDAEIAAIIGHELGHAQNEHYLKSLDKKMWHQLGAAALGRAVAKDNPQIKGLIMQEAELLVSRGYGFDKEWEADQHSFNLMTQTNYSLGAGAVIFSRMRDSYKNIKFSASDNAYNYKFPHPDINERIKKQLELVNTYTKNILQIHENGTVLINGKFIYKEEENPRKAYFNAGSLAREIHDKGLKNISFKCDNIDGQTILANGQVFYEGPEISFTLGYLKDAGCNVIDPEP